MRGQCPKRSLSRESHRGRGRSSTVPPQVGSKKNRKPGLTGPTISGWTSRFRRENLVVGTRTQRPENGGSRSEKSSLTFMTMASNPVALKSPSCQPPTGRRPWSLRSCDRAPSRPDPDCRSPSPASREAGRDAAHPGICSAARRPCSSSSLSRPGSDLRSQAVERRRASATGRCPSPPARARSMWGNGRWSSLVLKQARSGPRSRHRPTLGVGRTTIRRGRLPHASPFLDPHRHPPAASRLQGRGGPGHPHPGFALAALSIAASTPPARKHPATGSTTAADTPAGGPADDLARQPHERVDEPLELHPQQPPLLLAVRRPVPRVLRQRQRQPRLQVPRQRGHHHVGPVAHQVVHRRAQGAHAVLQLRDQVLLVAAVVGLEARSRCSAQRSLVR